MVGLPSGQQVARMMGVTPLTNAELSWNHRIEIKWQIRNNKVEANRRWKELDPDLQAILGRWGMARRGPAVVLHLEGGRDPRPGRATRTRRRPHRGRGPRRSLAEGPQLLSVLATQLEARPPIARVRAIRDGRSPQVRGGLVLTTGSKSDSERQGAELQESIVNASPRRASSVESVAGMALAAV